MVFLGLFLLADFAKGHSVIATSSGEAELYAAVSTMKDMIMISRVLTFIGFAPDLVLGMDSSAARAMLERQGAGRVRHVAVAVLWAQQFVKGRSVRLLAEPSKTNPADLGTKVHGPARFTELVEMLGLRLSSEVEGECMQEALAVAGVWPTTPAPVVLTLTSLIAFLSALLPVAQGAREKREKEDDDDTTGYVVFATWAVVFLIGLRTGIYMCKLAAKPVQVTQRRDASVQTRASLDRGTGTRSVETMSPVTYRRELQRPRFQPLGDAGHGAWVSRS